MLGHRITIYAPKVNDAKGLRSSRSHLPGHISIKFTEVEVYTKLLQKLCGILLQMFFCQLQANLRSTFIIEISEDKHRYFKRNFDEKMVKYKVLKKSMFFDDEMKTK